MNSTGVFVGRSEKALSERSRILLIGSSETPLERIRCSCTEENIEVARVDSPLEAVQRMVEERYDAVFVQGKDIREALDLTILLQNREILEQMPEGVALLSADQTILWANRRIAQWSEQTELVGRKFYSIFEAPEILGPDFCPVHNAVVLGQTAKTTLRVGARTQYELHVAPVFREGETRPQHLVVCLRDVTVENEQTQKLLAIHNASMQLADIPPQQLLKMSAAERIELLKERISAVSRLLNYDVIEIRLVEPSGNESAPPALRPLLSIGMSEAAVSRELYASPSGNGVTGFVAATGKSYLCEDTQADPLYLQGITGARSSVTVPLILKERVIGTFNVESRLPRAFTTFDLQCLEAFSHNVAVAINTLDLLAEEEYSVASQSIESIHAAVALPIDDIVRMTSTILDQYMQLTPQEVTRRVESIRQIARDVQDLIRNIGAQLAPTTASPTPPPPKQPTFSGRRILVVHDNASVRKDAHRKLQPFGCAVETAPNGQDALQMIRATNKEGGYDVIFGPRTLPDMEGIDFLEQLRKILPITPLPFVMMSGDGWDRGHNVVKAKQQGVEHFVYEKFILTQLVDTIRDVLKREVRPLPPATAEAVGQSPDAPPSQPA